MEARLPNNAALVGAAALGHGRFELRAPLALARRADELVLRLDADARRGATFAPAVAVVARRDLTAERELRVRLREETL
jgi:hypothetical protein